MFTTQRSALCGLQTQIHAGFILRLILILHVVLTVLLTTDERIFFLHLHLYGILFYLYAVGFSAFVGSYTVTQLYICVLLQWMTQRFG